MTDDLRKLLMSDSEDEDTEPPKGGAVPGSDDTARPDFSSQLAGVNAPAQAEAAATVTQNAGPQRQPSSSASKGNLILDPAAVLAAQQKAAANRSSAPHQAASAGVSAAGPAYKPAHQQVTQMPGHASSMMYRPVASAAPVHQAASMPQANGNAKPAGQNPYVYYQQLLAFADQRWKETNQLKRRQEARKLVTESKQDRNKHNLPKAIEHLVGDELIHEFRLTMGKGANIPHPQAASHAPHQQMPPQHMQQQHQAAGAAQQPPRIPPAGSQQQQQQQQSTGMSAAQQQQGQPAHMPGMARPQGPALGGGLCQPARGAVKQEALQQGMTQGQPAMRAASPPVRVVSPSLPAGLTQVQLQQQQQQQQQRFQQHQQQQQQHHQQAAAQQPAGGAARPSSAKRPASAAAAAPAAKRQAVKQEDEDQMDLLQSAGVNEEEEQEALFQQGQPSTSRGAAPDTPRLLNPHPLQIKVQEALRQYNVHGMHPSLHAYLNQAVWLHMEGLMTQACKMAAQRADLSRRQEGMQVTSDVRKALGEKAKAEREKAQAKEEAERRALLEADKAKDGDETVQRKVKEAKKEELERQSRAQTNQALGAALGGGARWQKFHARGKSGAAKATATDASATAAAAPASKPSGPKSTGPTLAERAAARPHASQNQSASASLPGASRSLLPPSRLQAESQIVGLKDLIAVMEHHPNYCKSDQLYKLYDRLDG